MDSSFAKWTEMNFKFIIIVLFSSLCCGCSNQKNETIENPPNILFAISDDQSFPHASAYGSSWVITPAFDRVAKEGLLFNKAYTPNAKCSPSRACILTGRNSWLLEEAANHVPFFPEKFKTFPEVLSENGYFVGRTGKGWAPGVATKDGNPRELIGKNYIEHKSEPPAQFISNNDYAANFSSFLDARKKDQAFFFWYGGIEPHRRYEFQAGIQKGNKDVSEITEVPPFWPDNDSVRTDMLDYAFEIEHFDNHLDRMLKLLEEKGELDNTIVIVTSDNGMPFPRIKGQTYEYDNHLPLAIMWGNGIKNPGRVINDYVNFVDFAPTILEAAGVQKEDSGMAEMNGFNLSRIFKNQDDTLSERHDFVLIGKERHDIGRPNDEGYPVRGIIQGDYSYTINFEPERWPAGNPETGYLNTDGSPTKSVILNDRRRKGGSKFWDLNFGKRPGEELYNIANDPYCMSNIANEPSQLEIKETLRNILLTELEKQGDPRAIGEGEIFDKYKYAHSETADFYTRFRNGEQMKTGWVNDSDFESSEVQEGGQ